ncbi:MAG: hypothetical protein ACK5SQ_07855, partial [Chitinophagales bacterium]
GNESMKRLFSCLLFSLLLISCNVTKHLDSDKGERLLIKNAVEFKAENRISLSERTSLGYETSGLFKQPTNTSLWGLRMNLNAYYWSKDTSNTLQKWIFKKVAEPPVLYNPDLARLTAENFQNFMRQRGYFDAKCSFTTRNKGNKKIKVQYLLQLGPLYTVHQLEYRCKDTLVQSILEKESDQALIKPGSAVDIRSFEAEKARITALLRNSGYALFVPAYVEFNGDSTGTKVNVSVQVLTPTDSTNHQQFHIGNVTVFSSLVPDLSSIRNDTTINGIRYFSNEPKFFVRPRQLDRAIKARPGQLYRLSELENTNKNISTMGAFRFVSVRPQEDTLRKDTININVSFAPADRISIGMDPDFNYSTSSVTGLIGGSVNAYFKHRNLFHGAELLSTNLSGNVEFDVNNVDNPIFSQEIKFQNDLILPRFFDYFGYWKTLSRIQLKGKKLVPAQMYQRLKDEGRARFNLTYDYLKLNNFYQYNLFNISFGYDMPTSGQHSYKLNHLAIELLQPTLDDSIQSICETNPFLCLSFSNQLFTGFLLRAFSYSTYTSTDKKGQRWGFQFNTDISGAEVYALNRILGKEEWDLSRLNLNFAHYVRLEMTGSFSRNFTKEIFAGIRVNSSIIKPFGYSDAPPYVKQFYVGGPSSMRAWRIRELGPGGYFDPKSLTTTTYYQASDFKFEFLSEIRFPVFWWFKGAIFLDGGNIWSISPDDNRPNSNLTWNSYQNFALGSGAGLRFDFGYSVLRFDVGLKLRYPYLREDTQSYWVQFNKDTNWRSLTNFNVAVGYPF